MQVKQIAWRAILPKDTNVRWLLVITVLVFVSMSLLRPTMFFTLDNFSSMAFQFPEFGLLAMAIMLTLLSGGIDLSIVGVANLSGILAALVLTRLLPAEASALQVVLYSLLALATSLVTGLTCGLINGLLSRWSGLPRFSRPWARWALPGLRSSSPKVRRSSVSRADYLMGNGACGYFRFRF